MVAVTHDRYFLDKVAGWILELDRGSGIPWGGNYSSWLEQKQARLAAENKADRARQRALERELEWIRMSPRARQSKGKARITAYNDLVAEAEAAQRRADRLGIEIPPGPRLGDLVVEATDVTKGYGDRLLMDGLGFTLPPGGIVGVIGANAAGKTTLFRLLVGLEHADSGSLRVGETVRFAYVDQSRDTLDAAKTVFEEIADGQEHLVVGDRELHGRAYLASFGFKGSDQQKKVGDLSGGERNRAHLATLRRSPPESVPTLASPAGTRKASIAISSFLSSSQAPAASIWSWSFACCASSESKSASGAPIAAQTSSKRASSSLASAIPSATLPDTSLDTSSRGS